MEPTTFVIAFILVLSVPPADICQAQPGMPPNICCHTFRATGITAYLQNGGRLEIAQALAAHESPRTTKLYDRTADEITLQEVERIASAI